MMPKGVNMGANPLTCFFTKINYRVGVNAGSPLGWWLRPVMQSARTKPQPLI